MLKTDRTLIVVTLLFENIYAGVILSPVVSGVLSGKPNAILARKRRFHRLPVRETFECRKKQKFAQP